MTVNWRIGSWKKDNSQLQIRKIRSRISDWQEPELISTETENRAEPKPEQEQQPKIVQKLAPKTHL